MLGGRALLALAVGLYSAGPSPGIYIYLDTFAMLSGRKGSKAMRTPFDRSTYFNLRQKLVEGIARLLLLNLHRDSIILFSYPCEIAFCHLVKLIDGVTRSMFETIGQGQHVEELIDNGQEGRGLSVVEELLSRGW